MSSSICDLDRIPAKTREELSPEQQKLNDEWANAAPNVFGPNGKLFVWADDRGAFTGPFPFMAYHPTAGKNLLNQMVSLAKLPLPPPVRETAILTTGTHFQAAYETYSHIPQAVKAGLSQAQAETIVQGVKPEDLDEKCSVAYDVARYLCSSPGPLPAKMWDKAVSVLGKDSTVAMVHYVGFYSYVCVFLNASDSPLPPEVE